MGNQTRLWNRFLQHAKNVKTTRLKKDKIMKLIRDYPVFCDVVPENVKVMVISEQAVHTPEYHRKYLQMGCGAYFGATDSTVPKTVMNFIDFDISKNGREWPTQIYYSHAIKYPLREQEFRREVVRFFTNDNTIDNDYDEKKGNAWFLRREIEILSPSVTVTFGGCGSKLLPRALELEEIRDEKLWKIVKLELEKYMESHELGFAHDGMRYIALYHPSGKNPGGKAVNEFFKERLRQLIRDELERH